MIDTLPISEQRKVWLRNADQIERMAEYARRRSGMNPGGHTPDELDRLAARLRNRAEDSLKEHELYDKHIGESPIASSGPTPLNVDPSSDT